MIAIVRRSLAAVAGTIAAALVLSGCVYSQIPKHVTSPSQPPSTVGVPAGLEKFYGQTLEWETCFDIHTCADVEVPLDYDDPTGRTIAIAVVRASATGGSPRGSLLTNPGGPGGSGVDFVANSLTAVAAADLRRDYDIIGFDPRGVGQSSPVTCLSGADMETYLYSTSTSELFSDAWWDEESADAKKFADACAENSDGILPFITTVNSARDMDVLRGVLGDDDLSYIGYSYGTRLGATYARLFPERAAKLVLDGAIDPTLAAFDDSVSQAKGFQTALTNYMTSCLASKDCPFRGTVDDALGDVTVLLDSMQRSPLPAGDGRVVDGYGMAMAIFTTLYSRDSWTYLTQAFTEALEGNGATAMFLVDFYNGRANKGEFEDNSTEAFIAYNCMDKPSDGSREQTMKLVEAVRVAAPTFADYWAGPDICTYWSAPPTGKPGKITAEGAPPIIVIGTTGDPATPYEESVALAEQLSSGVLVTRVGEGHTGYNKGNKCVDSAVHDFFLKDKTPTDGLRCE